MSHSRSSPQIGSDESPMMESRSMKSQTLTEGSEFVDYSSSATNVGEETRSLHESRKTSSTVVSPLKPLVMTEKDKLKLQMQLKKRKEKRLQQAMSTSAAKNSKRLVNIQNWRDRLAEFDFSEADLNNLEATAKENDDCPTYKQEAFAWIRANKNRLLKNPGITAKYYKLAFHDTYVSIELAIKALRDMVKAGLISQEEFDTSHDIARLLRSSETAQISIHSISNLVKKITWERLIGIDPRSAH
ncbi:hypothetical protein QR680_004464 [Steinernema hermaphroditum]|uniref:Uncharacterized protein n=1 Tax=Steinernema hermaphroditum TaxID=289476 RepID=A0AA39HR07_9BILA|nr:hypothetical protein QR680_004464 [Steinernema hermaphroditum]